MWKNNVNSQRRADLSADPCSRKHLAGTIIINVTISHKHELALILAYLNLL